MSALHFVGGEKGGVGKSVLARLLSQYFIDRTARHLAFDADQSHATLTRYYADYTQPINLDRFESTDTIMEQALDLDAEVLIDLPAQSQRFLDSWMEESGVLDLCQESDVTLNYWYVVDDGPDSAQLLAAFMQRYAGLLNLIVVSNLGCGKRFTEVEHLLASREQEGQQAIQHIELPALHAETMHRIDTQHLSFWAAANIKDKEAPHLGLMERQRTKVWLKKVYAAFDQVLATR
jgi:hypothetical protein